MLPPWTLHLDVLGVAALAIALYEYAARRVENPRRRQRAAWYSGVVLVLAVSYWPIHDLAEESLFSVHMVQHMTYTLLAPPLLLLGMTRKLADVTIARPSLLRFVKPLAHPFVAFVLFNVTLVVTHWPKVVNLAIGNEFFHLSVHIWLVITAVLAWIPVASPTPALPRLRPAMQILYLFFQSILPNVPASFLTFSKVQLYTAYGDGALAFGLTPVADQAIAGLIMKLGGTFIIWGAMTFVWFRWTASEQRWEAIEHDLRRA